MSKRTKRFVENYGEAIAKVIPSLYEYSNTKYLDRQENRFYTGKMTEVCIKDSTGMDYPNVDNYDLLTSDKVKVSVKSNKDAFQRCCKRTKPIILKNSSCGVENMRFDILLIVSPNQMGCAIVDFKDIKNIFKVSTKGDQISCQIPHELLTFICEPQYKLKKASDKSEYVEQVINESIRDKLLKY